MKLELKMFMTVLVWIKDYLIFSIYSAGWKYYDDSNVLIADKIKD